MGLVGVEPTRFLGLRILSPLRLPVSPQAQVEDFILSLVLFLEVPAECESLGGEHLVREVSVAA